MDKKLALQLFLTNLGDDALILSHRITEWCGHGPELEEDIALSNIGLDLLGQAQSLLNFAGELEGKNRNADDFAYKRNEREFTNLLLVEQPNGNYADTIARQFFFDVYHYYLLESLTNSTDEFLKGFAEKSIKEVAYHLRHSSKWFIVFGDGTAESHEKLKNAVNNIWRYTGEALLPTKHWQVLEQNNIVPKLADLKQKISNKINEIATMATLELPSDSFMAKGGRDGIHTENLGFILTDMQYLARTYPNATWD